MDRAFKKSSEGQRLNKLIREKNVDGFLPRSVGTYMNAAEGLASEAEAALRKARKYTDAAGGKLSAPITGTKRRNQSASTYKPKCSGCGSFDHGYKEVFIDSNFTLMQTPRLSTLNLPWGSGITISMGAVHQRARYGSNDAQERSRWEYTAKAFAPRGSCCAAE